MHFRVLNRWSIALIFSIFSGTYLNAQVNAAEFQEMKNKIEEQKIKIETLENRLNTTNSVLNQESSKYASVFMVLFLYGVFCAIWAQNTGRNVWTWFFLGLFFSVLTVIALLSINSKDNTD